MAAAGRGYPVATQLDHGRIFTAYYLMEVDGNNFGGALHIAGNFFRLAWSSPSSMGHAVALVSPKRRYRKWIQGWSPAEVWGLVWPPPNDAAVLRSGPVYDTSSTRMQPHRRTAYSLLTHDGSWSVTRSRKTQSPAG